MARQLPLSGTASFSQPSRRSLVVHVLESATIDFTAHARVVTTLGRMIDRDRYQLRAWFTEDLGPLSESFDAAGIANRLLSFGGWTDLPGVIRIARALEKERPDIVHLHIGGRSLPLLAHRFSGAKVIAHFHCGYGEDLRRLPLRSTARRVDAVIANSRAVASDLGVPVTVAYPGIAVPANHAAPKVTGTPTLGTVARLAPVKGHEHLLRAIARLRSRGIDVRAEIAGAGECDSRLKRLAFELNIDASVRFLGWCDDVVACHDRWQLFVTPSLYEGFGIATLEAMASGLPVVASSVAGLRELVEDGRTGLLVPPADNEALADGIERLLVDPTLRAAMGAAARRRAEERFSEQEMVAQIAGVYAGLLKA